MWQCPATLALQSPAIAASAHLLPRALAESAIFPSFWARGMVPAPFVPQAPSLLPGPRATDEWPPAAGPDQVLTLASDGSGLRPGDPSVRRCGWGVVSVMQDQVHQLVFGPLPGPAQTVARAELYALFVAVRQVPQPFIIWVDNSTVVGGYHKGPAMLLDDPADADLRRQLWDAIAARVHWVWVRKVAAHSFDTRTSRIVKPVFSIASLVGSEAADIAAKAGAALAAIPPARLTEWDQRCADLHRVIPRIAQAFLSRALAPDALELRPAPAAPAPRESSVPSLVALRAATAHDIGCTLGRYRCRMCFAISPPPSQAGRSRMAGWLRVPCAGPSGAFGSPHPSHTCAANHSLQYVWCSLCGAWGGTRLARLARPCPGQPPTPHAQATLSRLNSGRHPTGRREPIDELKILEFNADDGAV